MRRLRSPWRLGQAHCRKAAGWRGGKVARSLCALSGRRDAVVGAPLLTGHGCSHAVVWRCGGRWENVGYVLKVLGHWPCPSLLRRRLSQRRDGLPIGHATQHLGHHLLASVSLSHPLMHKFDPFHLDGVGGVDLKWCRRCNRRVPHAILLLDCVRRVCAWEVRIEGLVEQDALAVSQGGLAGTLGCQRSHPPLCRSCPPVDPHSPAGLRYSASASRPARRGFQPSSSRRRSTRLARWGWSGGAAARWGHLSHPCSTRCTRPCHCPMAW